MTKMRSHLKVGAIQKCVRSLMDLQPIQRFVPGLAAWLCHPEKMTTREFTIEYNGFNYRGVTRNRNDWCVYFLKNAALAEGRLLESTRRYVNRTQASFVCYDIGANVGHKTLLMAKVATRVIATEPVKGAFDRLREKLDTNGLSTVDAFQVAVDEHDGDVEFELLSPSDFLIMRKTDSFSKGAFGTEIVRVVNGDDFIVAQRLPMPHFIRVNAGRDTLNVLAGLQKTIRKTRPILLIECPPVMWGHEIDVEALKSMLYDDAEVRTFAECALTGTFSFEAFSPQARKLICFPEALTREAEMEACKLRGLGLQVAGGI